jgi:outer membrane immunogenic protein
MKAFSLARFGIVALLMQGAAVAADLPVKAPVYKPPVVAPSHNWTGCYLGAAGGGIWGSAQNTSADPAFAFVQGVNITNSYDLSGAVIGGTLGCNYEVDRFVFGLEGDFSWTNKDGSGIDIPPFLTTATSEIKEDWIGTGRARLGYAVADHWLVYATGGFAVTRATLTAADETLGFAQTDSRTQWGWTAGGGVEVALNPNWSLKAEYLYTDFGNPEYFVPHVIVGGVVILTQSVRLTDQMARVGLNYKFY